MCEVPTSRAAPEADESGRPIERRGSVAGGMRVAIMDITASMDGITRTISAIDRKLRRTGSSSRNRN